MKLFHHKSLMLASSLAMLLALGACDRYGDRTAGSTPADRTAQATSGAAEASRDAAARANAKAKGAAEDIKSMGAAAGDKVSDASITTKVNAELAADKDLSAIKIDVDTKDGVVTLTGPAPSASARERATEIAKNVKGVTSVNNQLTVKAG
jgi:hyperosmotically inducible periplasmic protein